MAQNDRRAPDPLMGAILESVHRVEKRQDEHYQETARYRGNNDRIINSHRLAIEKQANAIQCMKDYFEGYEKKHEQALLVLSEQAPVIATIIKREKFWSGVWDKVQEKVATSVIVAIVGGACAALWVGIKSMWRE